MSYDQTLEWALAAQWWGYKLEDFESLTGEQQAYRVAVYEVKHQMDAVLVEDAKREAHRQQMVAQNG